MGYSSAFSMLRSDANAIGVICQHAKGQRIAHFWETYTSAHLMHLM